MDAIELFPDDEAVLATVGPTWLGTGWPAQGACVCLLVGGLTLGSGHGDGLGWLMLAAPLGLWALVRWRTTRLVVTKQRVVLRVGRGTRSAWSIPWSQVESVGASQNGLGAFFNYGTIYLRGRGTTLLQVRGLPDPAGLARRLQRLQA